MRLIVYWINKTAFLHKQQFLNQQFFLFLQYINEKTSRNNFKEKFGHRTALSTSRQITQMQPVTNGTLARYSKHNPLYIKRLPLQARSTPRGSEYQLTGAIIHNLPEHLQSKKSCALLIKLKGFVSILLFWLHLNKWRPSALK